MRNQTKFMAVLSAAALMAAVAPNATSFTNAYAAERPVEGWTEEDGIWYFYDEDGYEVTDSWKKNGADWFYLNSDGEMVTNQKVDDYYVGSDGKMVTNQWVSLHNEEEEDSPEAPESFHYYFGKDGKAISGKWASIDGKWYYFNEEGQMQTGKLEIDGSVYYLGEDNDGAMKTGWVKLEDDSTNPDVSDSWYYFDNSGKMVGNQIDKKINGNYYTFVDGKMQTGWYKLPETVENENTENTTSATDTNTADGNAADTTGAATPSNAEASAEGNSAQASDEASASKNASKTATIGDYQYYGDENDGKRADGWHKIEGVEGINDTDEVYSFYFKDGKPHHAEKGIKLFNINSKKYAFNERGEMQTGLQVVNLDNDQVAHFYFGNDGVMKTGKQSIYSEALDQNQSWFFYTDGSKKGQGYHGIKDNNVYVYGLRQDASSDLRYAPAELDGKKYLVNAGGALQKANASSTSAVKPELGKGFKDFKDNNGTTWVVDVNGIVQE